MEETKYLHSTILSQFFNENIWMASLIAIGIYFLGFTIFKFLLMKFKALSQKTSNDLDDFIIDGIQLPIQIFLFVASVFLFFSLSPQLDGYFPQRLMLQKAMFTLWVFWVLWRISTAYFLSQSAMKWSDGPRQIMKTLVRFMILSLGLLFALDAVGVSITPLLASLGVGSLAVALALQDTLGNFFGGIFLWLDKPVQVGDFVRFDKDTEGTLIRIGWRTAQIRMPNNSLLILPNSKLASSQLINFSILDPETILIVPMGVSYSAQLEEVESVLISVSKKIQTEIQGGVATFDPLIRYTSFGDSSINFNVVLKTKSITDQAFVRHEFIKRAHQVLNEKGIEIPFPQRVVHLHNEQQPSHSRPNAPSK